MDFPLWLESIINGMIGGVIYIFIQRLGWEEQYEIIRRLTLAIIAGYIAHLMGHFDPLTTITAGYFGLDLVEAFISRNDSKKKKEKGN